MCRKSRWLAMAAVAAALTGCGYVGDPMPPALNIPERVRDLQVVQRGDKLVLDFTAPSLTTEQLGIPRFASAEVVINERAIPIQAPEPGKPAHAELATAADWRDKDISVRVRLAGPKGRLSEVSNLIVVHVIEPLPPVRSVKAEPHPEGVRVSWTPGDNRATKYRIIRTPDAAATVDQPEYIDRSVELGKEYKYTIVSTLENVESIPSEPAPVTPKDIFAPAVPTGLNLIAGVNSIELAWERNAEPDFKSYRVYRDDNQIAADLEAPAYSDKQVESGKRYRYAITSIDQAGNESAKSTAMEIAAP